jgi:hypothetical protein
MTGTLRALLLLAAFVAATGVSAAPVWGPVAEAVVQQLDQAARHHASGDREGATRAVLQAYFGIFESEKFEAAMRVELGARRAFVVEKRFGDLRKQVKAGVPADAFHGAVADLAAMLREDAGKLDAAGIPREVFAVNQ